MSLQRGRGMSSIGDLLHDAYGDDESDADYSNDFFSSASGSKELAIDLSDDGDIYSVDFEEKTPGKGEDGGYGDDFDDFDDFDDDVEGGENPKTLNSAMSSLSYLDVDKIDAFVEEKKRGLSEDAVGRARAKSMMEEKEEEEEAKQRLGRSETMELLDETKALVREEVAPEVEAPEEVAPTSTTQLLVQQPTVQEEKEEAQEEQKEEAQEEKKEVQDEKKEVQEEKDAESPSHCALEKHLSMRGRPIEDLSQAISADPDATRKHSYQLDDLMASQAASKLVQLVSGCSTHFLTPPAMSPAVSRAASPYPSPYPVEKRETAPSVHGAVIGLSKEEEEKETKEEEKEPQSSPSLSPKILCDSGVFINRPSSASRAPSSPARPRRLPNVASLRSMSRLKNSLAFANSQTIAMDNKVTKINNLFKRLDKALSYEPTAADQAAASNYWRLNGLYGATADAFVAKKTLRPKSARARKKLQQKNDEARSKPCGRVANPDYAPPSAFARTLRQAVGREKGGGGGGKSKRPGSAPAGGRRGKVVDGTGFKGRPASAKEKRSLMTT